MTTLHINGQAVETDAAPHTRLLDLLRDGLPHGLRLVGTREGCGANACGACHVLLDGKSVAACDTPLWAVDGKAITTVEGLEPQKGDLLVEKMPPVEETRSGQPRSIIQRTMSSMCTHMSPTMPLPYSMKARQLRGWTSLL